MESDEVVIGSAPSQELARFIVDALTLEGIRARIVVGSSLQGTSSLPGEVQICVPPEHQEAAEEILRFLKESIKNPTGD